MIIWTTAGLFSVVEATNPEYVKIKANSSEAIDRLIDTLRLIDIHEEVDHVEGSSYFIEILKEDVSEWLAFEMQYWVSEDLGRQFVRLEDFTSAIAYEKLLMNLEK
jgi:hypothetical protein